MSMHPTIGEGDRGPAVEELQEKLGCLVPDGDFGSITDTWVRAFQRACGLSADGIVGPMTWDAVDALAQRVATGPPRLPRDLVSRIFTEAATSEIADYAWPDRGIPPPGYIPGMALSFAVAARAWRAEPVADFIETPVDVMARAQGDPDMDALAWYEPEFRQLGMRNDRAGLDTLRHLFVMMIGLGPRESSGRYCEGRDLSADNVQSDTCEAATFQTSWNIKAGHYTIAPLLPAFWQNPNGFLDEFKLGVTATANNLNSYGSGDGVRYQFLSRFCPLFHVAVTSVGLRTLRAHWGPIGRREVTLKREADELLQTVQEMALAPEA